jgi:hypothetical protein
MEEILRQILDELRRQSTPSVLGFGDIPKTRYIYANRQYPDCLWYFWNGGNSTHEPIAYSAITGVIEKIEIEEKEFRGKPDLKLNFYIKADKPYVIQSGTDTLFAKGLIYTLSKLPVEAFLKPITIGVEVGDTDTVLFSRVYNPATGSLVFAPYPDNTDWNAVMGRAVTKVNQAHGASENE